ncbi:MAG: hypothetical protein QXO32_08560 [Candidatus Bathyarchaeia archaeon]
MNEIKPPVPVKVRDLANFARLAIALTEGPQVLWRIVHRGKTFLAFFTAYMYWDGDIPILAYTESEKSERPFLAYRSDSIRGEEFFFTSDMEDTKYKYASFIELEKPPEPFLRGIEGVYPTPPSPMLAHVKNINSIIRILFPLSIREGTVFPLWHFNHGRKHVVGTCIPFEHYYEADALPVFIYCEMENPPGGPFVKYRAVKSRGEEISFTDNTVEAKYFYAKIVSVESMPLFRGNEG